MKRLFSLMLAVMLLASCLGTSALAEGAWTVRLEGRAEGEQAAFVNSILNDSYIRFAGEGSPNEGGVFNLDVVFAGSAIVRLLSAFDREKLAFSLPDVDENRYEISFDRLGSLAASLVEDVNGDPLQLDPQVFEGPRISEETYEEAFTPYVDILTEHFSETVQTLEESFVLEKLGSTVTGTHWIYEPDPLQLAALFDALADQAEDDAALRGVVEQWADYIRSLGVLVTGSSLFVVSRGYVLDDEPDEDDEDRSEADRAADNLLAFFEQLPDILREAADELAETEDESAAIRFDLGLPQGGELPALARLELQADETDTVLLGAEALLGESEKRIALYAGEGDETYTAVFEESGSAASRQGSITLCEGEDVAVQTIYNWDLSRRSLLGIPYGTVVTTLPELAPLVLTLSVSDDADGGSDHKLRLSDLGELFGDDEITGFTADLFTRPTAEVSEPAGTPVDISEYDEEQLTALFAQLAQKITLAFDEGE